MTKTILVVFSLLSMGSVYATYTGMGLQEVTSEDRKSVRSHRSGSSGGWSFGK